MKTTPNAADGLCRGFLVAQRQIYLARFGPQKSARRIAEPHREGEKNTWQQIERVVGAANVE